MSSKFVPFVVHVRVVPPRPGKRFEYIRSLQNLSVLLYDELIKNSSLNLASPGGGQETQLSDIRRRGGFGSYANGLAVKPQMGQTPAQFMVNGFYSSSGDNVQIFQPTQRISAGAVYTGYVSNVSNIPTTAVSNDVKAIKTAFEAAIATGIPSNVPCTVFRIDYAGVVFGDRGYHFPI